MSYVVEYLLLNKEMIREKQDLNSDEFDDLIVVEKTLNKLFSNKQISDEDYKVFNLVLEYKNLSYAQEKTGITRQKLSAIFRKICDQISFELGEQFTDEGFIDYLAQKYNLDQYSVNTLTQYIKSKFRHKLLRSKFKSELIEFDEL